MSPHPLSVAICRVGLVVSRVHRPLPGLASAATPHQLAVGPHTGGTY